MMITHTTQCLSGKGCCVHEQFDIIPPAGVCRCLLTWTHNNIFSCNFHHQRCINASVSCACNSLYVSIWGTSFAHTVHEVHWDDLHQLGFMSKLYECCFVLFKIDYYILIFQINRHVSHCGQWRNVGRAGTKGQNKRDTKLLIYWMRFMYWPDRTESMQNETFSKRLSASLRPRERQSIVDT